MSQPALSARPSWLPFDTPSLATLAALLVGLASLPFAAFGLAQLATTAVAQLHGPAHVTDFVAISSGPRLLLSDPGHLYAPGAAAALDRSLTATDRFDRPFSFLPPAAIELAPLGLLPYGVAYLLWLGIGLASLAVSAWLLAPRSRLWPLVLLLFLPAQLALIMGQTSTLTLLAFCALVRLIDRRPTLAGVLVGLSPATWKPQLVAPALAIALAAGRQWRALVGAALGPLLLVAGFTVLAGVGWVADYRAQASVMWSLVNARSPVESAGQTLLGLAQAASGPGWPALLVAVGGGAAIHSSVAAVWWRGLRRDARRHLQLAVLPVAAVTAAPHALGYDLTLWLASAWLLLRYVECRPSARPLVLALSLSGWACANVIVLTENELGFPWAAAHGLAAIVASVWLYASHPREALADHG